MSFHRSCEDIHIRQEDGATMLLAKVRDSHGHLVPRKIRLDDHIGNTDGWFIWGGCNFTRTARNISLQHTEHGPKLCAELEMNGGGTRGLQGIMLSEKIGNNDGHLKFLAMPAIKPFFGRRDGAEHPEDYLEDIEYAVKIEKSHVDSDSRDWNCDLNWVETFKNDWERLKQEFTKRYRIDEVDAATRSFQITQKVATLSQGPNEHIEDYVDRCEDLESQAGTLESFGLNVVQGLADLTQKQRIMYDLFKGKDYSFRAATDLINAAYLSFDSGALQASFQDSHNSRNGTPQNLRRRSNSGRRVPNKIRLDDHIGRLVWGRQNFTHSAGDVSLEQTEHGAITCAEMNKDEWSRNRQELNLSEKIVNFDGQLKVV
ncbi:hypothetical protein CNMCM7691_004070 [Aspergillus felis]|uniref:Cyanovirin-N domain-containing protein n=1 Tax=Aspergillus felis TaxID=1287682 RepID=A0A8H6R1X5_9EURO|nr:hypothetical protein CNMCM7691_004070 [Aspergillus felis]